MKALILAAGSQTRSERSPWVLERLGERCIIDYVVECAGRVVPAEDIYLVIGPEDDAIRKHLGETYCYVKQEKQLGTGHAVWQARQQLAGYEGNLLILYGDTPLFRRSSIQGLINRHRQKAATLTLLTAATASGLPYGRIVRDQSGCIIDIAEVDKAIENGPQRRELNLGAYVVQANLMWRALGKVVTAFHESDIPFTACVQRLLHHPCSVANYQVLDEDEILGIDTSDNLAEAGLILKKRQLRPRRIEEQNIIRFGTGGWRALIGEGFTLDNVRRLCQALANDITRKDREQDGVLIGYDRRFLSDVAAQAAAEVFAGNNIPFACALVVEMLARTEHSIADMLSHIYGIIGKLFSREVNLPATTEMKVRLPHNLAAATPTHLAGSKIERISTQDGTKFYLENDNWLLLRFSGTEPLLRIFAEADTEQKVDELITWAQKIIRI